MASRSRYFSGRGRWFTLVLTTVLSASIITLASNGVRANLPFSGPTGSGTTTSPYPPLSNMVVGIVNGFSKWAVLALWGIVGTGIGDPMLILGKFLLGFMTHVYVDENAPRTEESRKRVVSWGDFVLVFLSTFGGAFLAELCLLILYDRTSNLGTPQVDPLNNGFAIISTAWFAVFLHASIVYTLYLIMVNHPRWTANVASAVGVADGFCTMVLYGFAAGETNTAVHLSGATLSSSALAVPARGGFEAGWWIYVTASLAAVVAVSLFIRFFFLYLNLGGIGTYLKNPSDVSSFAVAKSYDTNADSESGMLAGAPMKSETTNTPQSQPPAQQKEQKISRRHTQASATSHNDDAYKLDFSVDT